MISTAFRFFYETYGYEIIKYLNESDFGDIVEGTVYTILVRIEKKGFVEIEKKI